MRNKISSWVRQSRHRAKKHGVVNTLDVQSVLTLVDQFQDTCAYCGETANTLDHPFPLSAKAPNAIANVLPCCHECKTKKGTDDLVAFYGRKGVTQDQLIRLIREMLERDGGEILREHIKGVTGIGL